LLLDDGICASKTSLGAEAKITIKFAVEGRDGVVAKMTADRIAEAKKRAGEWKPTKP
jgi:hypothetical protein